MCDNSVLNLATDISRKNLLKRSTQIVFVLLMLTILYSIFQLVDWYLFFKNTNNGRGYIKHFLYYYRLCPLISIAGMMICITSYTFLYKSFRFQLAAVNNQDDSLFNKGLRFFNINLILIVIYFLILFSNILYRILVIKI